MMSELRELISECRELKKEVAQKSSNLNKLKEKIREFMIDSGVKEIDGVEIRRSFSFDQGLFKMKYPDLAEKFIREETITSVRDVVDKKGLKKHASEEYRSCEVENTARLYGL